MRIREYCSPEQAEGSDEGGPYRWKEVADISRQLQERMRRCVGCHDDFYNRRANCAGNHCWSLNRDENFEGRGRPTCYH